MGPTDAFNGKQAGGPEARPDLDRGDNTAGQLMTGAYATVRLITFEDIVNSIQAIEERISLTSAGGPTPRSGDVATRPNDAAIEWGELIG